MRKHLGLLALCLLALLGAMVLPAAALDPARVTVEQRPSVTILVDGTERTFYDVTGKEVHTLYYNGTHYLPVRAIGELMGKNVNWDGTTRTITLTSPRTAAPTAGTPDLTAKDAKITVEQRPDISIVVDGTKRSFQDAAGNPVYVLLNGGTNYLPVRAIGELMGKTVSWNGQTRTITLSGGEPQVTDADTFGPSGTAPAPGTNPGTLIGAEAAKSAALANAKLTAAQVTFVECKLDWEDGRQIYEVEFYTADGREYDYEIDAYTAAVLKVDYDAEGYVPPVESGELLTLDQARNIALKRVPGAALSHVRECEFDRDDCKYEGEILYNGYEYEFELDGRTGAVLKWECEHHNTPSFSWHHGGYHH